MESAAPSNSTLKKAMRDAKRARKQARRLEENRALLAQASPEGVQYTPSRRAQYPKLAPKIRRQLLVARRAVINSRRQEILKHIVADKKADKVEELPGEKTEEKSKASTLPK
eukprot:378009_1